jgi:hypothetical protein
MHIEMKKEDVEFLHAQLTRHLHEMEVELAHTDKRELQRSLAADVSRLQRIDEQLKKLLSETIA